MLISPPLDFTSFNTIGLYFQHAYASRFELADTLIVSISDDCGDTWTKIYSAALEELETAPENEESFVPATAENWCGAGYGVECNILDLSQWAGEQNIKIRFETFGRFGNNLYVDNVSISNSVGIENRFLEEQEIIIYPNPSDGAFNIMLPSREYDLEMKLIDVRGQMVYSESVSSNQTLLQLDASSFPAGIYMISFVSDEMNVIQKIIVH
jgi:hypothetical protein